MSVRARIVGARSVAGRIVAVSAALALFASAGGVVVQPAAAGLVAGVSIKEITVLPTNVNILPGDTENHGRLVLSVPVTLQAGQSRRISDQLIVTSPREVTIENIVECLDPVTGLPAAVAGRPEAHSSGTNYSPAMGQLSMHGSLLFTAPHTGTFDCQIRAMPDPNDPNWQMTAVAGSFPPPRGTWLEIDNFTDEATLWWQIATCNSDGTDPHCIYLGKPPGSPDHKTFVALHGWPPSVLDIPGLRRSDLWTAPPNATNADVVGHMQITSCYFGTRSCPGRQQGARFPDPLDRAVFRTHLVFTQLDQRNRTCNVTNTPETQYTITNAVHHFLVDYGPITVPISQTCGGSRLFRLNILVAWHEGNTVKVDAGSLFEFRSSTNANVIVRSTRPTTTVPNVIGVDQGSVAGHLAGRGLTVGAIARVVNPIRPGTVIAQNSPEGTIEPIGSPVDLTISLGAVTVPALVGDTTAQAISELRAVGLFVRIEYRAQCLDPGRVIDQTPSAGASVAPGSTVTITVDSGTSSIICN